MKRADVQCLSLKLASAAAACTALCAPLAERAAAEESVGKSLCALVSRDEAAKRVGRPVYVGKVAGPLGTACHWSSTDGESYLQIQAVPVDYWSAPRLAEGYRALTGIGQAAYVVPELGGWAGGAKGTKEVIAVAINGPAATADSTVELLKSIVEKRK